MRPIAAIVSGSRSGARARARALGREVIAVDLHDVEATAQALAGAQAAIYFADGEPPAARLVQASRGDLALLRADTLARAAARAGVGVIAAPGGDDEVAAALASQGARVIAGPEGAAGSDLDGSDLDGSIRAAMREVRAARGAVDELGTILTHETDVQRRGVVSLQRLPRPLGLDARAVAEEYLRWLPARLGPWVRAVRGGDGGPVGLRLVGIGPPLLELCADPERGDEGRALLRVSGGLLRAPGAEDGVLEVRCVLGGRSVLTLVAGFEPRLPWPIYRATQALLHVEVMRAFGRHLGRLPQGGAER